jgi:NmrA-like family
MKVSQEPCAPLVAVVGATRIQGGSVINALIESVKPYHLRGLTRDTSKPAACKLIDQGVEMVGVTIGTDNAEKMCQGSEGASIVFVSASILRLFHLLPGSFSGDDQFLGSHRQAEGKPLNLAYTYDPPLINLLQEIDDGILMINAAKAAKVELFI